MCDSPFVLTPQAVWIACNVNFLAACAMAQDWGVQYRKRYGLHAMRKIVRGSHIGTGVSIPQAVWIACNLYMLFALSDLMMFQYRKRYGLHAIPSLTALGTAEPRSGFSKRIALFGKSPQPRGIFLSPKPAENVRKPCDTKETFVHGKNLKLMAFFPKSFPSL